MEDRDYIQILVMGFIGLTIAAFLMFLYLASPAIVEGAYKVSTPIVKAMED